MYLQPSILLANILPLGVFAIKLTNVLDLLFVHASDIIELPN